MKTLHLILLSCLMLTLCSWGTREKGSGNVIKEQREVGHFTALNTSSGIHVFLTQGQAEPIRIEAEDNIIKYIETEVEKNRLVIAVNRDRKQKNLEITKPINVYVSIPNLEKIEASSASQIKVTNAWKATNMEIEVNSAAQLIMNLDVTHLDLEVSSAAKVQLNGKGDILDAEVSSAANLDAEKFIVRKADIEVSSNAKATIYVTDELEYDTNSRGKLDYYGEPRILKAESDYAKPRGKGVK
ncbi:MAG: DUF2807 domain-containing protein [Odoribacter sp.]|nr:DUF2807 domain-containing protein [Odoribacter sp.]